MTSKYKIRDPTALYFITFAVVDWVDALARPFNKDIVMDSIRYCIANKGMRLFAYVIMSNHVHLICAAKEGYHLSDILRDFKKFTSKKLLEEIKINYRESRRKWMLEIFRKHGQKNSNNQDYQLWQQDNHPIELSTNKMMDQRLEYIHQNPVKARLVFSPEQYPYSSAVDYYGGKGLIEIEFIG